MFVDEHSPEPLPNPKSMQDGRTKSDLLSACAMESAYQAATIEGLDCLIGKVIMEGKFNLDVKSLQKLDLLRQEACGLASVLALLASFGDKVEYVEASEVVSCLPLEKQRARIMAHSIGQ
jgi:hypothetical protein